MEIISKLYLLLYYRSPFRAGSWNLSFHDSEIENDINFHAIQLRDASGASVPLKAATIEGNKIKIAPLDKMKPSTSYTVNVPAAAVKSKTDGTRCASYSFAFTTKSDSEVNKIWTDWNEQKNVDQRKAWSIKFNRELDPSTIIPENIYVKDANDQLINVVLGILPDWKTVMVMPVNGYELGKTYYLYIT